MTQYVLGAITTCVVLEFVSPVPLDFDLFFDFDFEGALLGLEVGSGVRELDLSCCLLRRFSSFLPRKSRGKNSSHVLHVPTPTTTKPKKATTRTITALLRGTIRRHRK